MDGNLILRDLRLATMISEGDDPFGLIEDAVVAIADGRVVYAGPATHFAASKHDVQSISMHGRLALPGFVCCHNTVLWAQGATANPQQDARSYRRLVNETAELTATTSDAELLDCARDRLAMLVRSGVTTFELKSGFGRTPEEELRLAQLIRQLQGGTSALSTATLYAGHFIPEDTDPDDHLEAIVTRLLPQIQASQGCDAVQVFCDEAAGLDLDQASTILEAFYRKKTPSRVACDRFADGARP